MQKMKNEHAKFINTVECQQMADTLDLVRFYKVCIMQSLMHLQRGFDFFLQLGIYIKVSSIIQRVHG